LTVAWLFCDNDEHKVRASPSVIGINEAAVSLTARPDAFRGQCLTVTHFVDIVNTSLSSHTHTQTHLFNGPLSGTTQVSRYQKGKTNLDFTEARDSEWQRHQLGRMQVCTQLQTDDHASTPPLSFFTGWMLFLSPNRQCQSTEGNTSLSSFVLNCNCMHHLDLQPRTLPPYFSD